MTAHTIIHVELPATDREAAVKFYRDVFGWESADMVGVPYPMFTAGGVTGGFPDVDGQLYAAGQVTVHVSSDDIQADLKAIEAAGGKAVSPVYDLGAGGAVVFFTDPAGNGCAVSGAERQRTHPAERGLIGTNGNGCHDDEIQRLSADEVRAHQNDLIDLLRDVVEGGSSVNFIAPLDVTTAAAFWERVAGEAAAGQRIVVAALEDNQAVGCVHLVLATQPNGVYRAEVQKVLVHSRWRRQGIATRLMQVIEDEARVAKRRTLVLDTEKGSGAEKLYERAGYTRVGVIPQFALDSTGSQFLDAVFFYKLLD